MGGYERPSPNRALGVEDRNKGLSLMKACYRLFYGERGPGVKGCGGGVHPDVRERKL